jgi:pimeloyl-ACP methyl ester carboxylesterase
MVHGFWSSPVTWLPMFNDLRANPEIRKQYQFWFYMYPTGQPFWISARQLRDDLLELRHTVDPLNQSESMEQMVLVGHSMGGLLSRMQTIDSGDQFWNIFSEEPFEKMKGDLAKLSDLKNLFYFQDNQSVARVITIASPHHGTHYSNSLTRWVGQKLFSLPQMLESQFSDFVDLNRENLRNIKTLTIPTSVDSLAPDSLFIQKMAEMGRANRVMFHNIYGDNSENSWLRFFNADWIRPGDGVVAVESAKVQSVQSEVGVTEEHAEVHRHPKAIVEVRRILLDHLEALGRLEKKPTFDSLVVPAGFVPGSNGVTPGEMPMENR